LLTPLPRERGWGEVNKMQRFLDYVNNSNRPINGRNQLKSYQHKIKKSGVKWGKVDKIYIF
jgi:hypothetical protein